MTSPVDTYMDEQRRAIADLAKCAPGAGDSLENYATALDAAINAFDNLVSAIAFGASTSSDLLDDDACDLSLNLKGYSSDLSEFLLDVMRGGMLAELREASDHIEAAREAREDARYGSYEGQNRLDGSDYGLSRMVGRAK